MFTSSAQTVKDREPISHVDGIPWDQAPLPRRLHRCRPQSRGTVGELGLVERCSCGGTRLDGKGAWLDKNTRRKNPDEPGEDLEYIALLEEQLHRGGLSGRGLAESLLRDGGDRA